MINALKEIIKETYMNVCEEGSHKYKKLSDKDYKTIAENVLETDEFWSILDGLILDELIKYEVK